jgi:hypothetical protein
MSARSETIAVLVSSAGVAFALPLLAARTKFKSRLAWLLAGANLLALEWIALVQVDWTVVSTHLRYLPLMGALYAVYAARPRDPSAAPGTQAARMRGAFVALALLGAAALGFQSLALAELYARDDARAVDLLWPLDHTCSYVMQGGPSEARNHHVVVPAQARALDVLARDPWGSRMRGIYPLELTGYEAYGVPVISPCTGEVVAAEQGHGDATPLEPPEEVEPLGNYVAVYCPQQDVTVVLAHLRQGRSPQLGTRVRASDPLGLVGNSGNTTEPHLHVHAVPRRVEKRELLIAGEQQGVAMEFDGERLVRASTWPATCTNPFR